MPETTMSEKLQRKIEDAQVEGWELSKEQGDRAVLVKRHYGTTMAHFIIFVLLGWWTLGVANVCYLAYKYFADVDKKVVRVEE